MTETAAPEYLGSNRRQHLYAASGARVIVDEKKLTARPAPDGTDWEPAKRPPAEILGFIAAGYASSMRLAAAKSVSAAATVARSLTVPRRVRSEAQAALRSGSPLDPQSRTAAVLLSSQLQVTGTEVLAVHRWFESSDGASPAAVAAWGGAHGRKWAGDLAARLGHDSVVADAGDYAPGDLSVFTTDESLVSFYGHLRQGADLGGRLVDSLLAATAAGNGVWFGGEWLDAGAIPADRCVRLDKETALFAAASLLDRPGAAVDISVPDPGEWALFEVAEPELDTGILDAMAAAADGGYTSDERSDNASEQLRDANGRFAKVGDTGLVKSLNQRATISTVNTQGNELVVNAEDGQTYMIKPDDFEVDGSPSDTTAADPSKVSTPLDLSGILGQPRATKTTPKAWLKTLLQPMNAGAIKKVTEDYQKFINDERQARSKDFPGGNPDYGNAETEEARRAEDRLAAEAEAERERNIRALNAAGSTDEKLEAISGESPMSPDNSDVAPVYMAIVDPEDTRAVLDLIAMVPESSTDSTPTVWKRTGGGWIQAPNIMADLRSVTPPAVVKLESPELENVLEQVDGTTLAKETGGREGITSSGQVILSLAAAGGADRNRGNAEELRRYWTTGEGGAKIRWGLGNGSWRRCTRYLAKYLRGREEGYCALRFREMTGHWPGDRENR